MGKKGRRKAVSAGSENIEPESQGLSSYELKRKLQQTQRAIQKKDIKKMFSSPITDAVAPGYSQIIAKPMDFYTINKKITSESYTMFRQYMCDVALVIQNCMTYNMGETSYFKYAAKLAPVFEKIFSKELEMSFSIVLPPPRTEPILLRDIIPGYESSDDESDVEEEECVENETNECEGNVSNSPEPVNHLASMDQTVANDEDPKDNFVTEEPNAVEDHSSESPVVCGTDEPLARDDEPVVDSLQSNCEATTCEEIADSCENVVTNQEEQDSELIIEPDDTVSNNNGVPESMIAYEDHCESGAENQTEQTDCKNLDKVDAFKLETENKASLIVPLEVDVEQNSDKVSVSSDMSKTSGFSFASSSHQLPSTPNKQRRILKKRKRNDMFEFVDEEIPAKPLNDIPGKSKLSIEDILNMSSEPCGDAEDVGLNCNNATAEKPCSPIEFSDEEAQLTVNEDNNEEYVDQTNNEEPIIQQVAETEKENENVSTDKIGEEIISIPEQSIPSENTAQVEMGESSAVEVIVDHSIPDSNNQSNENEPPAVIEATASLDQDMIATLEDIENCIKPEQIIDPSICPALPTSSESPIKETSSSEELINGFALPDAIDTAAIEAEIECQNTTTIVPQNLETQKVPIIPEITPEQHLEAQLAASMIEMDDCKSEVIEAVEPEFAVKEEVTVKTEPTPDPEVPVKRKRGRPPKPKDPSATSPVRSKRAKTSKKVQAEKASLEAGAQPEQQEPSQEFLMPDMVEPSPLMLGHQLQDLPGCSAEYNSNYSQSNYVQSQSYSISNQQLTPNSTEYGQFLNPGQCTNAVFYPDVNAPMQTSTNQVVYHPNCLEGVPIGSQGSVYVNGPLGSNSEPVICEVPHLVPGEQQQLPSFSQLVTPQLAPKQGSLESRDVIMSPSFNPTSMCSSMESSIAHISPSILTFTPSTAMNYESSPTATKYFDDLFVTPVKPGSTSQPITNLNPNAPHVANVASTSEPSQAAPSVETTSSKKSSKRTGSATNEAPASKHPKTQSGSTDAPRSSGEAGSTTTQLPYVQIQINNRKYKVPSNTPLAGSMQNPLGYLKNGGLTGTLSFLPKTPCVEKRINVTKDCISSKGSPQKFQRLNEKSGPGRYRYLSYGPYGQSAPVKDKSKTFHKNSVHLDVLHSVYSGALGLQFAESLKNFTSGMNPYMKGVVNEFLDSFTNGRHSLYESCQYLSLPYSDDSQLTVTDKEIRSLKTLKKLGIDTSFIDGSNPKISADTILKCVDSVIKTNACDDRQGARHLELNNSATPGDASISNTLPKSDVKTPVSYPSSLTSSSLLGRPANQNLPRIESLASVVRESSNSLTSGNGPTNVNSSSSSYLQAMPKSSTSQFQSQTASNSAGPNGSAWQSQPYIGINVPNLSIANTRDENPGVPAVDNNLEPTNPSQNIPTVGDLPNANITSSESIDPLSISVVESLPSSVEVSQSSRISSDLDFSNLLTFDNPTDEVPTIPVCTNQNQNSSMELIATNFLSNDLPVSASMPLTSSEEQNFISRFVDSVSDVDTSHFNTDTRALFDESAKVELITQIRAKASPMTGSDSFSNCEGTVGVTGASDPHPDARLQHSDSSQSSVHGSELTSFAEAQMSSTFDAAMEVLTNNLSGACGPTEGCRRTAVVPKVNVNNNRNYRIEDNRTAVQLSISNVRAVEFSNFPSAYSGPETEKLPNESMETTNAEIPGAQYLSNSTDFHKLNHLSNYQNNLMDSQEASISNKSEQGSRKESEQIGVPTSEAISCETSTCSELSVSVPSDSFGSLFLTPSNQNGNNCHDSSMQLPSSISPFFDAFGHIEMLTTPNPDSKMSNSDDQSLPDFKFSPDVQPDTTTATTSTNGPSSGHDMKESLQSSLCNGFAEEHSKCTTIAPSVSNATSSKMSQFNEVKRTLPNAEQQQKLSDR
ncbi:uncharacterized protein LOC142336478 [Convolutriloba macropyga]|uniref:uncharacterized protein LOC142336478 n=1 Tax=Convolutriloba macropyga TaxID=536237 RepID=UPI003F52293E